MPRTPKLLVSGGMLPHVACKVVFSQYTILLSQCEQTCFWCRWESLLSCTLALEDSRKTPIRPTPTCLDGLCMVGLPKSQKPRSCAAALIKEGKAIPGAFAQTNLHHQRAFSCILQFQGCRNSIASFVQSPQSQAFMACDFFFD